MDELDGAEFDAARGLAYEEHARRLAELAPHHQLLLVAAGEEARSQARIRRAHVEAPHERRRGLAHLSAPRPAVAAVEGQPLVAEDGRFPRGELHHQRSRVPVFGNMCESQAPRRARIEPASRLEALARERETALFRRAQAREHVEERALAVARDARNAHDLARA